MFRIPRYSIFLFVGLSILTAYLIHHGTQPETSGSFSFSSASVDRMMASALTEAEKVGAGLPVEMAKCDCVSKPQNVTHASFEYEDPASCTSERKIVEELFRTSSEISPLYRDERAKRPAEFPKACMLYIMNEQFSDERESRKSLAKCSDNSSAPIRGAAKACVTTTYVNTIYNYFGDITDCMELPQRDLLPKIFTDSGFHLNALGASSEVGIGQLTDSVIAEANKDFQTFKEAALSSGKESCQRLSSQLQKLSPASAQGAGCGFIGAPENPLRNLFYMSIAHHQNSALIQEAMKDFKIVQRMAALGLSPTSYDREQVIHILLTLGHNTGARTAVILLSNYLKRMETARKTLTLADFDFGLGVQQKEVRTESGEKEKVSLRKLTPARKNLWNFPGYLAIHQKYGTAGYVTLVRSYADDLNKIFKEGVCVPDSYLAL